MTYDELEREARRFAAEIAGKIENEELAKVIHTVAQAAGMNIIIKLIK